MIRRLAALLIVIISLSYQMTAIACDKEQTNSYVLQILFGNNASEYESNENAEMLLNALYICSEQSDDLGVQELQYLKSRGVNSVPTLTQINVKSNELGQCSHQYWNYEYSAGRSVQNKRKKVLRNTINKVFDFGVFFNLIESDSEQCNNIAALLFYSHILADYLAGYPENVEYSNQENYNPAYQSGEAEVQYHSNTPNFSNSEKQIKQTSFEYKDWDNDNRCDVAFAVIDYTIMSSVSASRDDTSDISPSGWEKYKDSDNYIYQRCHLIAHQFGGSEDKENLFTGTKYLNNSLMKKHEGDIKKYLLNHTNNHVLYRVTPKYIGNNLVPSGVQMEAYSIEDSGGLSLNVYCYNIQPNYDIDYSTGAFKKSRFTDDEYSILPFAVPSPSENNPDLVYEIEKYLEKLFINNSKGNDRLYNNLMTNIKDIGNKARSCVNNSKDEKKRYIKLKGCAYELYETLRNNVPLLLQKQSYMKAAFY